MPRKKPRIEEWSTEEQCLRIQSWATRGDNVEDISKKIGIASRTFYEWLKRSPAINKAYHSGGEIAVALVENALFKKALSGDLGAICFYLNNRAGKYWSNRPELQNLDGKVVFIDDIPRATGKGTAKPKQSGGSTPDKTNHP